MTHPHVSLQLSLPPSHSLNIFYFPPTHLHSLILPTLCYYPEIYTSLDQSSGLILCCYRYTLFKVRYFSARSSRMGATGGHLDRVYLEQRKGRGRFGHPEALPLGIFESSYKRTASEGDHECSISRDCEQSINVIIDRNQLFYHVN